jgi:hypothetical protein
MSRGGVYPHDHADHRHYEDCWNELAKMFASTQVLPPRTKRWAEAKVLADCVAIRVSPRCSHLTLDMPVITLRRGEYQNPRSFLCPPQTLRRPVKRMGDR